MDAEVEVAQHPLGVPVGDDVDVPVDVGRPQPDRGQRDNVRTADGDDPWGAPHRWSAEQAEKVRPVTALDQRLPADAELVRAEESHPPGDLLGAGDLHTLPLLDRAYEVGRVVEIVER